MATVAIVDADQKRAQELSEVILVHETVVTESISTLINSDRLPAVSLVLKDWTPGVSAELQSLAQAAQSLPVVLLSDPNRRQTGPQAESIGAYGIIWHNFGPGEPNKPYQLLVNGAVTINLLRAWLTREAETPFPFPRQLPPDPAFAHLEYEYVGWVGDWQAVRSKIDWRQVRDHETFLSMLTNMLMYSAQSPVAVLQMRDRLLSKYQAGAIPVPLERNLPLQMLLAIDPQRLSGQQN